MQHAAGGSVGGSVGGWVGVDWEGIAEAEQGLQLGAVRRQNGRITTVLCQV